MYFTGKQHRVGFKVYLKPHNERLEVLRVTIIRFRYFQLEDLFYLFSSLSYTSVIVDLLELLLVFLYVLLLMVLKLAEYSYKLFIKLLLASLLLYLKASDYIFQVVNRTGKQFSVLITSSLDLMEFLMKYLNLLKFRLIALIVR